MYFTIHSKDIFVLNSSWELMRAGARLVFCFFVIYLVLKCYLSVLPEVKTRTLEAWREKKCCTEPVVTMFKSN